MIMAKRILWCKLVQQVEKEQQVPQVQVVQQVQVMRCYCFGKELEKIRNN